MLPPSPLTPNPFTGAPALVVRGSRIVWLEETGELLSPNTQEALTKARTDIPVVCHMPSVAQNLSNKNATGQTSNAGRHAQIPARDILELFAFVRPAQNTLPSIPGLAQTLGIEAPHSLEAEASSLITMTEILLADAAKLRGQAEVQSLAFHMAQAGWSWGPAVLTAVEMGGGHVNGFEVWTRLEEWEDIPPEPQLAEFNVSEDLAEQRLRDIRRPGSEDRPEQIAYTRGLAQSFQPRRAAGMPQAVLAEAGTGVGKTMGYIAPASVWAEETGGTVWVSTFTKNLQRQVDQELEALFPNPEERHRRVVVRKGRENYVCLLNFEQFVKGGAFDTRRSIMAGLLARWVQHTRDGDMVGGDLPGWLAAHIDPGPDATLTDRRGECIYSACAHYRKCFIERAVRRSRRADFVVANHALVMVHAAMNMDPLTQPLRYIFDEGHHIFEAADSAFSLRLSGAEGRELRRWLLGVETRRSASRGLAGRAGELCENSAEAMDTLHEIQRAAQRLPDEAWRQRLIDSAPHGPLETLLGEIRHLVRARAPDPNAPFDLEARVEHLPEGLLAAVPPAAEALAQLMRPITKLMQLLESRLDTEADTLDTSTQVRIEATLRALDRRRLTLKGWQDMLLDLNQDTPAPHLVDWFGISRFEGRDRDVAMNRHFIDPTGPFSDVVLSRAHGVVITSATLRDRTGIEESWSNAEQRTGIQHLPEPAQRVAVTSPFDYAKQTEMLIVTDVAREDVRAVSAAFRELFRASDGGALGLFTAINRLRQVHAQMATDLEDMGYPVYAQHVDPMDNGSLVDMFRGSAQSCLLGTDALRDGVDIPGDALRLIVFDRVPWPRRTLLHTARKKQLGGDAYDDMLIRLKLKQAFGRLIRRADDYGVFVMLDSRTPSRLLDAIPEGVTIRRLGLADAITATRNFLAKHKALKA